MARKTITIQVSERDYEDLIRHLATRDGFGQPLVAVTKLVAIDGDEDFNAKQELGLLDEAGDEMRS